MKKYAISDIVNGHIFQTKEGVTVANGKNYLGHLIPPSSYMLSSEHGRYLQREITHPILMTLWKQIMQGLTKTLDVIDIYSI